jgi:hypothetical protein
MPRWGVADLALHEDGLPVPEDKLAALPANPFGISHMHGYLHGDSTCLNRANSISVSEHLMQSRS